MSGDDDTTLLELSEAEESRITQYMTVHLRQSLRKRVRQAACPDTAQDFGIPGLLTWEELLSRWKKTPAELADLVLSKGLPLWIQDDQKLHWINDLCKLPSIILDWGVTYLSRFRLVDVTFLEKQFPELRCSNADPDDSTQYWMTEGEVREYWPGMSPRKLKELVEGELLPYYRLNRHIEIDITILSIGGGVILAGGLFKREDVEQFGKKHRKVLKEIMKKNMFKDNRRKNNPDKKPFIEYYQEQKQSKPAPSDIAIITEFKKDRELTLSRRYEPENYHKWIREWREDTNQKRPSHRPKGIKAPRRSK